MIDKDKEINMTNIIENDNEEENKNKNINNDLHYSS